MSIKNTLKQMHCERHQGSSPSFQEEQETHAASTTCSAPFRVEQRENPKDSRGSFLLGWKVISKMQKEQRSIIKRR